MNGAVDPALIERLRADLVTARYTVDALGALWGGEAEAALERGNRLPAVRALVGHDSARATLATLFVLGMPVSVEAAEAALPTVTLAGARELGLCWVSDDEVVALLDLRPYDFLDAQGAGSWWIASDLGELATGSALRTDHVLGVGGASLTLSGLLIPDPVESVLDLGTGCGIQAMHASRWAGRVVATDISPRALEFARLNAALNGIANIEFRLGSLFEPVVGAHGRAERFDRIVSNPPFVITPRTDGVPEYEYRDGGMIGDALVESVIRGARDHLVPGGIAQLLGNWEYRAEPAGTGTDGLHRAAGWADAAGLDCWIIERERQDPAQYAETWIRDGGTRAESAEFERLCGAWLDDFAARGVTGVGFGYVLLRHPESADAPRVRRIERLNAPLGRGTAGLGSHLASALAAADWQAARTDDEVLAARLTVASDVTEERSHWPGEPDPSVLLLRQGGGFRREVRVGTELAAIVGACDGELSLGAIVVAVAQLLERDLADLRRGTVAEVRELLVDGVLLVGFGG